ncbi:type VI secretion system tip protein VgrG [Massilia sp. CCM 8733]|uniref:Type VI secretion system tip protein VgrG n=1 Tax=Massilia mucilaginosa TaxID=2609282 RepID=A0ABX0NU61_9BURK|nr:type VI secretion system Vgr family protein [Massilia mucilaginosa]NHZ90296.1 type VI secretion system tip protein VgrG [Massilia mucilaginosa]
MGSISAAVASMALNRQHNRIMRLTFPHADGPDDVLLANRLEAREELSRDFEYNLEVLSDNASIALKDVQGKMVTIELVRGDGSLRYFNGYVFAFQLTGTDGSVAFYSMLLKPWLAYLKLRRDNYVFHDATLRDQTTSIFDDYGTHPDWDCRLRAPETRMTMACQFAEDDHNYLHRRWEAAGWHYWYEHTASGHKLVLSDDSPQAAPIDGRPDVRFQRHGGALEEDAIGDWSPVRDLVAASVALASFDFKHPQPAHTDVPTVNQQGTVLKIESYEYTGAYGFADSAAGADQARLRMEEIEASGKHFTARGNNRFSMPGRSFRLAEHFHDDADGAGQNEFLIVGVHHSISNNYLQHGDTPSDYSNHFTCIRKRIPWRPGRGYNSTPTRILAPQTATVVTPGGEDVFTDAYGRVRVQFHWDRVGSNDERSSAWLRVSSPWAGAELGAHAIPRKGQEVVVVWLDGNPDRPIISGAVYNENNMPPWKVADQKALMGIRSRELTPGGGNAAGGRSNHLVLDDSGGQIQAQLKSDHQHSQLSLGHITRIEDNMGRKDSRGEGFALETNGAGALRASRGLLLSTDGRTRAVGGTLSRDELVRCLEQALDLARSLGEAAEQHEGGARDPKPQESLTEAVSALGHGSGDESGDKGRMPGGVPVIALTAAAGIASATPMDQTHFAGKNMDTVARHNQQHYAGKSILQTAGKDIEQFALDGDIRSIANKGKLIQQAQHNAIEITADKSITMLSTKDHILMAADKHITLTSGGAYIKLSGGNIEIVCPGNLIFKSAARAFTGPGSMKQDMPKFEVGGTGRKFMLHRDGDKLDKLDNHNYKIKLDDGQLIEGKTGKDGLTKLAEKDVMRIADIKVWKDKA